MRRIGVPAIEPHEIREWLIDARTRRIQNSGFAELRLIGETFCDVLGRQPAADHASNADDAERREQEAAGIARTIRIANLSWSSSKGGRKVHRVENAEAHACLLRIASRRWRRASATHLCRLIGESVFGGNDREAIAAHDDRVRSARRVSIAATRPRNRRASSNST